MHFTVKYSRDFCRVYQVYATIHHKVTADFSQILENPNDKQLEEAFKLIHLKESVMLGFLNHEQHSPEQDRLLKLIPPLKKDYWERITALFEDWAPRLEKELNAIGPKFNVEIEQLLGAGPSQSYTLAIVHNFARPISLPGQQISNEPFLCLAISENRSFSDHIGVILHEAIHHIIRINGWKSRFKNGIWEEAFVKLLAPQGVLTERLGIDESNLDKIKEEKCDKELDCMRPYFKEYMENGANETIFQFLERKKAL